MSLTLMDFLRFNDPAEARRGAQALNAAPELAPLPAPLRPKAADALVWSIRAVLRDPLTNVIGAGWSRLNELQKFDEADAEQVNTFALHEHEIALTRQPAIEIDVNGAPSGVKLTFELKIALSIKSAELRIQNKRIIGAQFAGVKGNGALSLGSATIAERETAPVKLPAQLNFSPGLKIL